MDNLQVESGGILNHKEVIDNVLKKSAKIGTESVRKQIVNAYDAWKDDSLDNRTYQFLNDVCSDGNYQPESAEALIEILQSSELTGNQTIRTPAVEMLGFVQGMINITSLQNLPETEEIKDKNTVDLANIFLKESSPPLMYTNPQEDIKPTDKPTEKQLITKRLYDLAMEGKEVELQQWINSIGATDNLWREVMIEVKGGVFTDKAARLASRTISNDYTQPRDLEIMRKMIPVLKDKIDAAQGMVKGFRMFKKMNSRP